MEKCHVARSLLQLLSHLRAYTICCPLHVSAPLGVFNFLTIGYERNIMRGFTFQTKLTVN
eukprot:1974714-Karenia_brevis.AAC.1